MQNNDKSSRKRRKYIGTRQYVSEETGDVVGTDSIYKTYTSKSRYVSMYLDDDKLSEALDGLGNFGAAWGYVLRTYNHETLAFYFSQTTKEDMCNKLALSIGTVRSAIKSFTDSGLLLRYRGAEYLVNPSIFYRGHYEDRAEMIKMYDHRRREVGGK